MYRLLLFDPEEVKALKITRANTLRLWEQFYGCKKYAEDFHGYLMCRDAYGNSDYYVMECGERIYCGWNLHHILPVAHGGTDAVSNLICTNIETNQAAGEQNTYWIDENLYHVRRIFGEGSYEIIKLK
jgi:hypothetical protein